MPDTRPMMNITRRGLLFGAAAVRLGAGVIWKPSEIRWQRTDPDGSKYAVIDGDRDQVGKPFTYALWMPAGLWVKAHTNTQQAHVAVARGSLLLGFGRVMDPSKATAIPAGGYFVVRADEAHFACR